MGPSSQSLSNLLSIGYKRTLYTALTLTCVTPGILHLYLQDRAAFGSLSTIKTVLIGLAIASPVVALNMAVAFAMVYLMFARDKYYKDNNDTSNKVKRLSEEKMSRIVVMSAVLAASLSLNLSVVAPELLAFKVQRWHAVSALVFDLALVLICIMVLKKKVDIDIDRANFYD